MDPETALNPSIVVLTRVDTGDVLTYTLARPSPAVLEIRPSPTSQIQAGKTYRISMLSVQRERDEECCAIVLDLPVGIRTPSLPYQALRTNVWEPADFTGCINEAMLYFRFTFSAQTSFPTCGLYGCETAKGESCQTCEQDCSVCPPPCDLDGTCEPGETSSCADCSVSSGCAPYAPDSLGDDARLATEHAVIKGEMVVGKGVLDLEIKMRNVGTTTWSNEVVCGPEVPPGIQFCFPRFTLEKKEIRSSNPLVNLFGQVYAEEVSGTGPTSPCSQVGPAASTSQRQVRLRTVCSQDPHWPTGTTIVAEVDWQMVRRVGDCTDLTCTGLQKYYYGEVVTTEITITRPPVSFAGHTGADQDCDDMPESVEQEFLDRFNANWRFWDDDCDHLPARLVPKAWRSSNPVVELEQRDGTIYGQAYPVDWFDCERCVAMNHLSLWRDDCGFRPHPGDIEALVG